MTPSDAAALGGGWCGGAADHDGFFEQPKRTDGRVAIDDCGTAVAATALRPVPLALAGHDPPR